MDPMGKYFEEILGKIKASDFSCIALTDPYKNAKAKYKNVHFVQEGFDVSMDLYDPTKKFEKEYDSTFIGCLRDDRKQFFDQVKFQNFNNKHGQEHYNTVQKTKINLNFTAGGTSDRTYKILAGKGFLLTQPWDGMEKDFAIGYDLDVFNSPKELKEKIEYYLHHPEKRTRIAEQGFQVVQKFSRDEWARKIIKIYQEL